MNSLVKIPLLASALVIVVTIPLMGQPPDLTKDSATIDRKLTYNLGATGLRGWIYTKAADNLDAATTQPELRSIKR